MIDMTLAELLTGLDLSDEEIAAELKQNGPKPEEKPEASGAGEKKPKRG